MPGADFFRKRAATPALNFSHVRLAALAYDLPREELTSKEIEHRLAPVYQRLGLEPGRLELATGIRARRHYALEERPSAIAARAAERALAEGGIGRERIGLLIHAAVCRDFLEPATAALVHRALSLTPDCSWFDLSNACLGFLDGMEVAAQAIEGGRVEAALVVSGENGRALLETTLRGLAQERALDRRGMNRALASLTIGGAGAAALLTRAELAPEAARVLGSSAQSASAHVELCRGMSAVELGGPWMETESEALMLAGNQLAAATWRRFLEQRGWQRGDVERVVTHQVGAAHRRLLLETLELPGDLDFPTFAELGNTGSAALPVSLALARERGFVRPGERVALLGIGSGLVCRMLALA